MAPLQPTVRHTLTAYAPGFIPAKIEALLAHSLFAWVRRRLSMPSLCTVASGKSWHGFGACDENIKRQIDNHNRERKL